MASHATTNNVARRLGAPEKRRDLTVMFFMRIGIKDGYRAMRDPDAVAVAGRGGRTIGSALRYPG